MSTGNIPLGLPDRLDPRGNLGVDGGSWVEFLDSLAEEDD